MRPKLNPGWAGLLLTGHSKLGRLFSTGESSMSMMIVVVVTGIYCGELSPTQIEPLRRKINFSQNLLRLVKRGQGTRNNSRTRLDYLDFDNNENDYDHDDDEHNDNWE